MRLDGSIVSWVLLVVLACTASSGSGPGEQEPGASNDTLPRLLDVNDVTILFDLGADGLPFPNIPVTDLAGEAPLWRQQDFEAFKAFAQAPSVPADDSHPNLELFGGSDERESYRVVGLRFDPCAPTPNAAGPSAALKARLEQVRFRPGCIVQIRLVAQPFRASGSPRDLDMTAHLVFSLHPDAKPAALVALRRVQAASIAAGRPTAGVPLGVHPGLASGSTEVGGAVRELVRELAGGAVARSVAFMGLRNRFEPWVFLGGFVLPPAEGEPAVWRPVPIPSFLQAKVVLHQRLSFIEASNVIPEPSQAVSTAPLFAGSTDADLAFAVDDPLESHIAVTDCVSCHTSTARIYALDLPATARRVPSPKGVTGYAHRSVLQGSGETGSPPQWNVRNLGYFKGHATVSLRTVAESAEVAKAMNLEVTPVAQNPGRLAGPGRDCTAHDQAVWTCMVKAGGDDCLSVCGELLQP